MNDIDNSTCKKCRWLQECSTHKIDSCKAFDNPSQICEYNSFGDYLKSLPPNTVFRLWEYKRMFTPYEQEQKFSDESLLVNDECDFIRILDVINLPDGDLLLATTYAYGDGKYISYYKLSEISLGKSEKDMEKE